MIITLQKLLQKSKHVTEPRDAHALALDLVESMLRHYAVVAIAAYRHAGARDQKVNRILSEQLPRPSMGSWKNFLQMLTASDKTLFPDGFREKFLAPLTKKVSHPDISPAYSGLRKLADQDVFSSHEAPAQSEAAPCTPLEFFDAAVAYRNRFAGHGTHELPDAAVQFAPQFLKGAASLCTHLNTLWSACPVYVAKQDKLYGRTFFRLTPLMKAEGIGELQAAAHGMEEDRLYICFGDKKHPEVESLYPAALWEEDDILFANGTKGLIDIHYIGYASQRSFETSIYEEDFREFLCPFSPPRETEAAKPAVATAPAVVSRVKGKWKPIIVLIGVILLIIAAVGGYFRFVHKGNQEIKSIAVLPFIDDSPGKDQDALCEGIAGEIRNSLVNISDLEVSGRQSSSMFKGKNTSYSEIGRKLNVVSILEGSVRKEGDNLRIIATLIRASDQTQLFSFDYDRKTENLLTIEKEIARSIVDELQVKLAKQERAAMERRPTNNPEAYMYYVKGAGYLIKGYTLENVSNAQKMFEKAVELDNSFALAYTYLSLTHAEFHWFYYDRTENRLTQTRENAEKALHLNPQLPEAHLAMGTYYQITTQFDSSLKEFEAAYQLAPRNGLCLYFLGINHRWRGKLDLSSEYLEKALKLDPLSQMNYYECAINLYSMRAYSEALRYLDNGIILAPENVDNYCLKSAIYIRWQGDVRKARAVLNKAPVSQDMLLKSFDGFNRFMELNILEGHFDEALELLSRSSGDIFESVLTFSTKAQLQAQLYGLMGNRTRMLEYYESARTLLESLIQKNPDYPRYHSALGIVYAGLGRKEDAIREGEKAVVLKDLRKEMWMGIGRVEDLARIYTMTGEYEKALDKIEYLLKQPGTLSPALLRIHPDWKPLHGHPRFKALIAE
ncbi:MAG: hypothetical protein Q8O92_11620 [Candidatus Latescibacter sp.]|nr:hypothetical protein [Candidatus Latescibacter sp.]